MEGWANTKEARLEHTRNVNAYPNGATPAGVLNLAGNVFEWTATDFSHYPGSDRQTPREPGYEGTYQVVRGGSFDFTKEYAMTTTRVWAKPEDKGPRLGFRCAAEPKRATTAQANLPDRKKSVETNVKMEVASAGSGLSRGTARRIQH